MYAANDNIHIIIIIYKCAVLFQSYVFVITVLKTTKILPHDNILTDVEQSYMYKHGASCLYACYYMIKHTISETVQPWDHLYEGVLISGVA